MTARRRRVSKRDLRLLGLLVVLLGTVGLGYLVTLMPSQSAFQPEKARLELQKDEAAADQGTLYPPLQTGEEVQDMPARVLLGEAKQLLEEEEFELALEQLNSVRERVAHRPEALVLVGEALLGKGDLDTAWDFFNSALDRDPMLADAYFGMAVIAEARGDLALGLSGMRSYLHLQDDPRKLKVAQARSAIWEWESQLGEGPWGPTKGIPPGFTADELKRDGKGVGTKMPLPGTENQHGISRYEIRLSDKIRMFEE